MTGDNAGFGLLMVASTPGGSGILTITNARTAALWNVAFPHDPADLLSEVCSIANAPQPPGVEHLRRVSAVSHRLRSKQRPRVSRAGRFPPRTEFPAGSFGGRSLGLPSAYTRN